MKVLRTLVVDDERLAREALQIRLRKQRGIEVIGECRNGRQAIEFIQHKSPDLVFLDIQMPGLNGFDVIKRLQGDVLPMIVFVTALDQYAIDAFDVHAVDYLLKPTDDARLSLAIQRAMQRKSAQGARNKKDAMLKLDSVMQAAEDRTGAETLMGPETAAGDVFPDKLMIKDGQRTSLVPTREIEWIDAAGDYMCVHTRGDTHIIRCTMKTLSNTLDPAAFQRIHRSTIVNINRIQHLKTHINGEYKIEMSNDVCLKVSRSYKKKLDKALQLHLPHARL